VSASLLLTSNFSLFRIITMFGIETCVAGGLIDEGLQTNGREKAT
jgi:hypothetical protein